MLAFQGATNLFKEPIPLVGIMEINNTVSNFGHRKEEIMEFLNSYGYSLYGYKTNTNQINPINLETKQGNNVLAIANFAIDFISDRLSVNKNETGLTIDLCLN